MILFNNCWLAWHVMNHERQLCFLLDCFCFPGKTADALCCHRAKQESQALWMKASSSCCTLCPGLPENNISKPWKVSFLEGAAFIWQQQQNVLLFFFFSFAFYTWMPLLFLLLFYCGSAKSFKPGNTSVSSENQLLSSTAFASCSPFSLQFGFRLSSFAFSHFGRHLFFLHSCIESEKQHLLWQMIHLHFYVCTGLCK